MGLGPMSRNTRVALFAVVLIVLILAAAQCAYNAGHWIGSR